MRTGLDGPHIAVPDYPGHVSLARTGLDGLHDGGADGWDGRRRGCLGRRRTARVHAHIRAAQARVAGGGLFCLRVNATGTDIWPEHGMTERHPDGGLTVRYL